MRTFVQKTLVVATVVGGLAFGSGMMDGSAGPQQTNHFERGDSGGSTPVIATETPA